MANIQNRANYDKLKNVLKEVFQLNQADLDFGIYRIMNQKRNEINDFLENRLLPQVKEILQSNGDGNNNKSKQELEKAIEQANSLGVDPETLPKVIELRNKLNSTTSIDSLEQEVYSHLANFFKRYYKDGDFISLRRYKRDVYAIPYEGEEVKLHWANHDQYYIKSSEYLKNYGFKLPNGKAVKFELKEASTEQNNNKEQSGKERRFKLFDELPIEVTEDSNTLIVNFTYEEHDKKVKQDKLNIDAIEALLKVIPQEFHAVLEKRPTEKNKNRTLIEKHILDFTARNSFDYFIHKDLEGFLTRELDFYIKNEVLYLDDINTDNEQDFTAQLSKVKAMKQVAHKIITFLAQLENFQKKLWLKKKFVVSTNYCITLDRIPEKYYEEIAKNKAQLEEWKELFKIDKIKGDLLSVRYTEPLSIEFLKSQPYLVLDTKFFEANFKSKLISEFEYVDDNITGLLINSNNFDSLVLLSKKYQNKLHQIYIDPPYNTNASEIVYKNGFKHSSWLSFMNDRFLSSQNLLIPNDGVYTVAIDDTEFVPLCKIMDQTLDNFERNIVIVNHHPAGAGLEGTNISATHEYAIFMTPTGKKVLFGDSKEEGVSKIGFIRTGTADSNLRIGRPNSFYALLVNPLTYKIVGCEEPPKSNNYPEGPTSEGLLRIYPKSKDGTERVWRRSFESCQKEIDAENLECSTNFSISLISSNLGKHKPIFSNWTDKKYNAGIYGTNILNNIIGESLFSYPKSIHNVKDCLHFSLSKQYDKNPIVMDYFAGSGTTGHAVTELNKELNTKVKFILVEMGTYFETVTKPRNLKVVYSKNWKNGLPLDGEGISAFFKYHDLESYEDVLNNLTLVQNKEQSSLLASSDFKDEYMLSYMLDIESRDSLLNVNAFKNPFNYKLNITRNNESQEKVIDLVETFNYLIGLHVKTMQTIRGFKVITGVTNERDEETLIIWRNTEEKSNKDLNDFFSKMEFSTRDSEFQRIYVNGDNHLENLKTGDDNWKVVLIEEEFMKRMFDVHDV